MAFTCESMLSTWQSHRCSGLRRAGASVAVYERDASPAIRAQGYRISLKDTGAKALNACLPPHLFDLAVATSIRPATRMIFMDPQLRPRFAKPIPQTEPGLAGIGVNRLTLREILLTGVEDIVHFGETFDRYRRVTSLWRWSTPTTVVKCGGLGEG